MSNTLTDINNMMARIGCFNKTQQDSLLHQKYLNESLDTEAYKEGNRWGMKKARHSKDPNDQIIITNSYTILYNASPNKNIQSLLEKGPNIEYVGSSAGTYVWGKGIYTNFQRYQAHYRTIKNPNVYGTCLVKFKYHGNILNECLVAEPQLWTEPLSKQIEKFKGLKEFLEKRHLNIDDMDRAAMQKESARGLDAIRVACGGGNVMAEKLLQFGVQGVIFYGQNDRPVAVIYDADKLEILDWAENKGKSLDDEIDWQGVGDSIRDNDNGNDIRPILMYFTDFDGDWRYMRPHCGQLLLVDKNTSKFTFIDYKKAKHIIANHSDEDPRLFGDFEFKSAQNFKPMGQTEMAFVQLDEGEESQFFIDKEGNLYRNPNGRPYSHIDVYYDTDSPMGNEVEDDPEMELQNKLSSLDIPHDDEFDEFAAMFGESIKRVLRESLATEDRTETSDGHVEIDNFDLAKRLMKFDNPDNAYFIKIAERHKDHPDRYYEHDACAYKSFFEVVSVEHLNAIEPVIKRLCQQGEWRAMMYINPRQMTPTREFAHNVLEPRFKRHKSHLQGHEVEVAYGQSKDWDDRPLCFVDVDNDDPNIHKQVLDYISKMGLQPLETYYTTNNGLHIILPDKENAKKLDFSFLDKGKNLGKWSTAGLEIDKAITLYAYVKAKGYGVQQKMQQRKLGITR